MKTLTKTSLVANVILAGLVVWLGWPEHPHTVSPGPVDRSPARSDETSSLQNSAASPQFWTAPFRWSRLESTDYRTYVANLRGIGCPEQTIRDILSADLDTAWYAERRRLLEQQLSQTGATTAGEQAHRVTAAELNRLSREEAALIASLLGLKTGPEEVADNPPPPARRYRFAGVPVQMPLVFQEFDSSGMNVGQEEADYIQAVRQMFQEEMAGAGEDPADPNYRERWQVAQRNADESLRGLLGRRRYEEYQAQAGQITGEK